MPYTTVTLNLTQPTNLLLNLASQGAFNHVVLVKMVRYASDIVLA
jgi:hypothetical protein